MFNHIPKYQSIALTLIQVIGKIDGKNIEPVKKGTRTIESVNLLNDFIANKALMPDVFIDDLNVTTAKTSFNLILLNLMGEVNNIFLDIESATFKTLKKDEAIPKNTMTLQRTLQASNWFKMKTQMIENGTSEDNAQTLIDNSSDVIEMMLHSSIIIRENQKMESKEFFKLAIK